MGRDALILFRQVLQEALDIGSSNWDSYLEGSRWPQLKESKNYQKLFDLLVDNT